MPYRGGPALTDLLAGQVQVFFPPMVLPIERVRGGKLRALAVTTATRSEALLDSPTVGEFVPRASGTASAHLRARPLRSSTSSTRRPTLLSPIPRSEPGWLRQVVMCSQARLRTSASLLPMKPRSGASDPGGKYHAGMTCTKKS
jgi:Tripartite tricarboxylate transporter family receptor